MGKRAKRADRSEGWSTRHGLENRLQNGTVGVPRAASQGRTPVQNQNQAHPALTTHPRGCFNSAYTLAPRIAARCPRYRRRTGSRWPLLRTAARARRHGHPWQPRAPGPFHSVWSACCGWHLAAGSDARHPPPHSRRHRAAQPGQALLCSAMHPCSSDRVDTGLNAAIVPLFCCSTLGL